MKIVLIVLGALIAIVLLVVVVGWSLPVKHRASRQATYPITTPESLYAAITSVEAFSTWRSKVTSVERVASPTASGTIVRITEDGEVFNPVYRFMSAYVFGHHATIDAYLTDLGRKFNTTVSISDASR